jgi:hypothetical protein
MNQKQEHEMCKTNVKMNFHYANICKHEHKITWQNYGARSCLRLVLNRSKEIKGPTFVYIFFGTCFKEVSKEAFMCVSNKKVFFKNLFNWKSTIS